ncbi:MAG: HD domain-containing protein, partial [Betaproteobacteria bacterium]|nr:HD domain-containing protein [Betaproteobacteria bacterium]
MRHMSGFPLSSPALLHATANPHLAQGTLERARSFACALLETEQLDTGENIWQHAQAVAAILAEIGGSEEMQAAGYLVYTCPHLNKPEDVIAKAFGENLAALAMQTNQLVHLQRLSRAAQADVR